MIATRYRTPTAWLVPAVLGALVSLHCGSSGSPTGPGTNATLSAITFSTTSVAAGGTLQGTVTLASVAPAQGATVSLTSSNPTVATVQTPVTVQAGASSATFLGTNLVGGMTPITASLNGAHPPSPTLTIRPPNTRASTS